MSKYGIYKKTIREIYDDMQDEKTQVFQIRDRKTYNTIIDEMEKEINTFGFHYDEPFYCFEEDIIKNYKSVYFAIGKWRYGMCELFIRDETSEVHICSDTKEFEEMQEIHKKQIDKFIEILDRHRWNVIICKRKYDDIRWTKE